MLSLKCAKPYFTGNLESQNTQAMCIVYLPPNQPPSQPFVSAAFFSTVLSNLSTPAIKLLPTSFLVSSSFFDASLA